MSEGFTIKIFVPDGDPDGVRIVERMNWTGLGLVVPRNKWMETKGRPELSQAGVYILVGWEEGEEDLPTIYVGEGDIVKHRIESHFKKKVFWDQAIIFTAGNRLNKAYVKWLEHALVKQAKQANRSKINNDTKPNPPALSEAELADVKVFLGEVLQILPIVGVRAFESPRAVATNQLNHADSRPVLSNQPLPDTMIVPAQPEGFQKVFLGEKVWYAVRIAGGRLNAIKYIAAYQTHPTSAITHYAPVSRIEQYGDDGKYKLIFAKAPIPIGPIPLGDAPKGAVQSPRYTYFAKLQNAKTLTDLF